MGVIVRKKPSKRKKAAKRVLYFKDVTFNDLVQEAAREIHSALLEDGGKGLRREIHLQLDKAIRWDRENRA